MVLPPIVSNDVEDNGLVQFGRNVSDDFAFKVQVKNLVLQVVADKGRFAFGPAPFQINPCQVFWKVATAKTSLSNLTRYISAILACMGYTL